MMNDCAYLDANKIVIGRGDLLEPLAFPSKEYEDRLCRVRKKMLAENIDVLVAFSPENINYITGHDTPAYQYLQACIITQDGMPINLLRSIDASNTLYRSWNRTALVYGDSDDPVDWLAALIGDLKGNGCSVGLEKDPFFIGASRYNNLVHQLLKQGQNVVEQAIIEEQRLIKSTREIAIIRSAAQIAGTAMKAAISVAAEGVNENDIAACVWAALIKNGGEFPGLPPFIVSGQRTSLGHATWSGRVLQNGDSLAFEIPGVVARYAGPLFRSGVVGSKSDELKHLENATLKSLEILIDNIKPGAVCEDIHALSVRNFSQFGYTLGHRSGYSVGVNYAPDWGEGNILSIRAGEKRVIEEGMVFHLVPGIYVEGKHVVVISETVVVTSQGCECLTNYPREIFVV